MLGKMLMGLRKFSKKNTSDCSWELHPVTLLTDDVWKRWDFLNQKLNRGSPVLDSKLLSPMCQHFGEAPVLMAILEVNGADQGCMLLQKGRAGDWCLFVPGQACVGPLMFAPQLMASDIERVMSALFRTLPELAFRLQMPKQDPILAQLAGTQDDACIDRRVYGITTSVDVSGEFEEFWAARHKEVRRVIRKTLVQLEERGITPKLNVLTACDHMANAVSAHGQLESCGWKGQQGSAISSDNDQGKFYTQILESFAGVNGSYAYQLRFGDTLAASLLTIAQQGVQVVLKTTYDESLAQYAPGRLIDYMMLANSFSQQSIKMVENYTSSKGSDRRWSSANRPISDVDYYRGDVIFAIVRLARRLRPLAAK